METTVIQNHKTTLFQNGARIILGCFLLLAGIGHLTWSRTEFLSQVPPWLPIDPDLVVLLSGFVEIVLGLSLLFLLKQRVKVGWIVALFFVLVFPGNIAQLVEHRNAFGLDTDAARWARLPFQPVLIIVALWSTGAWQSWRNSKIN
ncbi:DoxX family membrane protein [Flavobacterium sp. N3904]|uniref:DoxX family protein n=1 Tax=Flavobacterium sp. N3904 TaxID=2986835 RepID=UPI0022259D0D|nr:DoxX family membrane protein [Flavobacterium sp. N3904]